MSDPRSYAQFRKDLGTAYTVCLTAREAVREIDEKLTKGWALHQILRDEVEIKEDELRLDADKEWVSR